MKVTKELQTKIKNGLREKYRTELDKISVEKDSFVNDAMTRISESVYTLSKEYPDLREYLETAFYGDVNVKNIRGDMGSSRLRGVDKFEKRSRVISTKIEKEYEEIVLKIQYGKDLDDMIRVLEEYGLKF